MKTHMAEGMRLTAHTVHMYVHVQVWYARTWNFLCTERYAGTEKKT